MISLCFTLISEALIYEECLDVTTTKLVENSSWVNASILGMAIQSTIWIEFDEKSDGAISCINAWIYFTVIFLLCIISLLLPKCWENTDSLRRDLETKMERKQLNLRRRTGQRKLQMLSLCNLDLTASNDPSARIFQMTPTGPSTATPSTATPSKRSIKANALKLAAWRPKQSAWILNLVEQEANELLSKLNVLIVASLSNAVAIAWRDSVDITWELYRGTNVSATAAFFHALFMTVVGLYIVVRLGKYRQRQELETIDYIQC